MCSILIRLEFFRGRDRTAKDVLLFSQTILIKLAQAKKVLEMGKRKVTNEGNLDSMVLPSKNDVLGIAIKMLGGDRIMVKCQDGKER